MTAATNGMMFGTFLICFVVYIPWIIKEITEHIKEKEWNRHNEKNTYYTNYYSYILTKETEAKTRYIEALNRRLNVTHNRRQKSTTKKTS